MQQSTRHSEDQSPGPINFRDPDELKQFVAGALAGSVALTLAMWVFGILG